MTYFSLRKRADEPELEEVEEDQPEETEGAPEEEKPAKTYGPILSGLFGPPRWLAARFSSGVAAGVHVVAVWAIGFYGDWVAAGIAFGWLAAVLAFVPREHLEQLAARVEKRAGIHRVAPGEAGGEGTAEGPPQPDPQDVLDLVRDVVGSDRGALLTALRQPLRAADTRAVRGVLAGAGIRVREGVRTRAGNGPGVHRDDLPPTPPTLDAPTGGRVVAGEGTNNNTNTALTVEHREGMTIIRDPADRHRTHTLKKP